MKTKEEKKVKNKLTYEELEAYTSQVVAKAQELAKQNQMLQKVVYENSLREVEIALKCLDHEDMFTPEFINRLTTKIEEVMLPKEDNSNTEENKE